MEQGPLVIHPVGTLLSSRIFPSFSYFYIKANMFFTKLTDWQLSFQSLISGKRIMWVIFFFHICKIYFFRNT